VQLLLCQERFLARLATLKEGPSFIWKGGSLVLRLYRGIKIPRYTVDIDLLTTGKDMARTEEIFRKAMGIDLADGFKFTSITTYPMERDTPYGGERFELGWQFFNKGQSETLKIDVCAGDDVDPQSVPERQLFLAPPPGENLAFLVYPPEFIYAEKLETVARFATGNTRFKDFIDLWNLLQLQIPEARLRSAAERCFRRRGTLLDVTELAQTLTDAAFIQQMDRQRQSRYKELPLPPTPHIFGAILDQVRRLFARS